jgi:manganese transport protein
MNLAARRIERPVGPAADELAPADARDTGPSGPGILARGRILGLIGPAFVVAIAFADPGNVATNVSAGSRYRYLLLWAVVAASLMAMLVQYLSAKLGFATGRSLAEVCRDHTTTPVRIGLWLVAEVVVIMTDLAEFVGASLALNLLFGLPLLVGGVVVAIVTMVVLQMRIRGYDAFPAVVVALLTLLAVTFAYLVIRSPFDAHAAAAGLVPHFAGTDSALLACGIIGATVMPHAVFMHSSLVGGLSGTRARTIRTSSMLKFLRRDVLVAMGAAGIVNVMMLLVATSVSVGSGDSLIAVHRAFGEERGAVFAAVFAVALLASGLASACAGVYTGQAIMRDFLRRSSSVWVRRLVSTVPALIALATVSSPSQALVLSQVVLSFGLPFAVGPLLLFTSRRSVMGEFVNRVRTVVAGLGVTAVIVGLNLFLLARTFGLSLGLG